MAERLPDFVTFTGLDARTDLARAVEIAARWPVEFGVLYSAKRSGLHPRYPGLREMRRAMESAIPRLALHVCGQAARDLNDRGRIDFAPHVLDAFSRVQVNHPRPRPTHLAGWAVEHKMRVIAQTREGFEGLDPVVAWLFDQSGGTGTSPSVWPKHPGDGWTVGYAGGISQDNVRDAIERIPAGEDDHYWLDMESGVRTNDWLDLDKCEAVCRAIWEREDA